MDSYHWGGNGVLLHRHARKNQNAERSLCAQSEILAIATPKLQKKHNLHQRRTLMLLANNLLVGAVVVNNKFIFSSPVQLVSPFWFPWARLAEQPCPVLTVVVGVGVAPCPPLQQNCNFQHRDHRISVRLFRRATARN